MSENDEEKVHQTDGRLRKQFPIFGKELEPMQLLQRIS